MCSKSIENNEQKIIGSCQRSNRAADSIAGTPRSAFYEVSYKCPMCGNIKDSEQNFYDHIRQHYDDSD
ncbi:hypothetical protein PHLGIDRAFT_20661 [Phlebiopsis gigantea 11061_1 CR5-6]|uniref:C2H2-type domain-containing protein n=1 Tax=Phlebiopsis gigantea (strain 11061_1 CR5-6) TaxID=745531 RepID=A0A0C3P9R4_PHLG1|nr:hypothetical protein PHLGIDRAFT_20661 [Phlebiopsis gigantea 11061_1 CR5-6]